MKKFLAFTLAALLSSGVFANDQQNQINSIEKFVANRAPMLFEGQDEVGECRIMIYSANSQEVSNIWFEGTFQNPGNGPVAGFLVPVLVSSSSEIAQIKDFKIDEHALFVKMQYAGEPSYSMTLEKSSDARFSSVSYTVGHITRKCLNLKRLL